MRLRIVCGLFVMVGYSLAADPVLHVSEADAKKAAIEKPAPVYPMMARQLKVKGRVSVDAVVDEKGSVAEVKNSVGNPALTKAAVDAVKKWKFKPFQQDGKIAAAMITLSFEFDTN